MPRGTRGSRPATRPRARPSRRSSRIRPTRSRSCASLRSDGEKGAMKILITGGGGFIGSRLAAALRAKHRDARIRLLDVGFPPALAKSFECITGDLAAPDVIAAALGNDTDTVFHLAAVVSGGAEADFDLGYRVNLDGTRALLEACRKLPKPPKLVFASSVAAFGGKLPDVLDDSTT